MSDLAQIKKDIESAGFSSFNTAALIERAASASVVDLGDVYLVFDEISEAEGSIFVYFIQSRIEQDVWPVLENYYRSNAIKYVYGVYVSEGMRAKAKARAEFEVISETAASLYGRFAL